jgi:hypothetical protein
MRGTGASQQSFAHSLADLGCWFQASWSALKAPARTTKFQNQNLVKNPSELQCKSRVLTVDVEEDRKCVRLKLVASPYL